MSTAASSSSARKRQKTGEGSSVDVLVAAKPARQGPVLALFPSSQPSVAIPFSVYADSEKGKRNVIVAETESMEWDSRNHLGAGEGGNDGEVSGEGQGYSVQYMLGVHNPRTNTLTLHAAPLHSLSSSIKALKGSTSAISTALMMAQRAELGATFGTKKAIRALNANARNKLDHESYGVAKGTQSLMLESLATGGASLPSADDVRAVADLSRPIPTPNFDAQAPEEVYDMEDIVTKDELEAIDLDPLLCARTIAERTALLPHRYSKFITARLRNLVPIPDGMAEGDSVKLRAKDLKKLRYLIYLTYMMSFRHASRGGFKAGIDRSALESKMGSPASILIDGLLERFTELARRQPGQSETGESKVTPDMELKLLSHMFILILKVDRWGTDVGTVAEDLKLPPKRVQELFRSVGCTLLAPTSAERAALLSSGAAATVQEARSSKRAVLRVPLVFPKVTRGAPKR